MLLYNRGKVALLLLTFVLCGCLQTYLWVVNTEEGFHEAFKSGATGVMTDYPSLLKTFLAENPQYRRNYPDLSPEELHIDSDFKKLHNDNSDFTSSFEQNQRDLDFKKHQNNSDFEQHHHRCSTLHNTTNDTTLQNLHRDDDTHTQSTPASISMLSSSKENNVSSCGARAALPTTRLNQFSSTDVS